MEDENFPSAIINIDGRQYPIEINYIKSPCLSYVSKAAQICKLIHENKPMGDILVFLTGQEEIESFISYFNNAISSIISFYNRKR